MIGEFANIPPPTLAWVPFHRHDRRNHALPGAHFDVSGTGLAWGSDWYGPHLLPDKTGNGMIEAASGFGDGRFQAWTQTCHLVVWRWDDAAGSDNWAELIGHVHDFDGFDMHRFSSEEWLACTVQTSSERAEIRNDISAADGNLHLTIHRWVSDFEWELSTYDLPGLNVRGQRVDTGAGAVPGGTWPVSPTNGVHIGGDSGSTVGLSGLKVYGYIFWGGHNLNRATLQAVGRNPRAFLAAKRNPYLPALAADAAGISAAALVDKTNRISHLLRR